MVWWDADRPPHSGNEIYYKRYIPDPTAVIDDKWNIPKEISITAYPNPFNSMVNLTLNDMKGGDVGIAIYNIRGRLIRNLTANIIQGGDKKAVWDATDNSGRSVSSGIYFVQVVTPQAVTNKKLVYLR